MKLSIQLALIAASLMISACASVPMSDPKKDEEAKKFTTQKDMSRIYLYRNETLGSAIKVPVTLNGKMKGETAKNVYFAWDVKPGKHEVSCLASSNDTVSVNLKKNEIAYIWQEMKMGLMVAGCKLNIMEKEKAQKAITKTKLAKDSD